MVAGEPDPNQALHPPETLHYRCAIPKLNAAPQLYNIGKLSASSMSYRGHSAFLSSPLLLLSCCLSEASNMKDEVKTGFAFLALTLTRRVSRSLV